MVALRSLFDCEADTRHPSDGASSPSGADAWLARYRREQQAAASQAKDSFEDETEPVTVDQPVSRAQRWTGSPAVAAIS